MKVYHKLMIVVLVALLLLVEQSSERRGKGSRRRKISKQNSKIMFHSNTKRADYYLNENVSKQSSVVIAEDLISI